MDLTLPTEVREGLEKLNIATAAQELLRGGELFVESEQLTRKAERLDALDFPSAFAQNEKSRESRRNQEGLGRVRKARRELRAGRDRLDRDLVRQLNEETKGKEFRQRLDDARASFIDALIEQDLPAGDTKEVLKAWDRGAKAVRDRGLDGAFDHLDGAAEQVEELRAKEGRGREPGSPLPKWKIWLIVGAIAVGIAAVVACFWWWGCSWIKALLEWAAPAVFEVVQNGC